MTFLNKKEQVFDIQLTQYGKSMLARGLFKPQFYSFHDDDVIYDSSYTGAEETANEAISRIKTSLRTGAQYNFRGLDTETVDGTRTIETRLLDDLDPGERSYGLLFQPQISIRDNFYPVSSPIGVSYSLTNKAPNWKIRLHDGKINKGVTYDLLPSGKIPQIEIEANWTSSYAFKTRGGTAELTPSELVLEGTEIFYKDATSFIKIDRKHIILEIEEKDSKIVNSQNYEIEVFKILEDSIEDGELVTTPPKLKKLNFYFNYSFSEDREQLLSDDEQEDSSEDFSPFFAEEKLQGHEFGGSDRTENTMLGELNEFVDETISNDHVEYYFDLSFDNLIDRQIICKKLMKTNKVLDIYSDDIIECNEIMDASIRPNIYRPEEYEDPCD